MTTKNKELGFSTPWKWIIDDVVEAQLIMINKNRWDLVTVWQLMRI